MGLLLGIDIGTSATKGVLCDQRGAVVAEASSSHELSRPRAGWSEQEPTLWWRATVDVIREVIRLSGAPAADVQAVGLSGQMHGSVFLSREALATAGQRAPALRPALLWNDQRTAPQVEAMREQLGSVRRCVELVGNAPVTGFTLPKILWLREHEPDVFMHLAAVCLPKDYVRLRLTGRLATDVGDAAGTLLFDVANRRWSEETFAAFELDPLLMPETLESGTVAGEITRFAAEETGLARGTPVIVGSGDNQCGAVGAGVVEPGQVLAALGTSGVVYAHSPTYRADLSHDPDAPTGRIHAMCAPDGTRDNPGHWALTGCMLSAAGSLQWARHALFGGAPYEQLLVEASETPVGAEGLLFMPHLSGERCPYPDPAARGAWIGLTARHERAHLVRAILEGVAMTMRQILDLFCAAGVEPEVVRLGGGGARSAVWRQIQADAYALPCALPAVEQGPAHGAALLAGVGSGVWASVAEACRDAITVAETRDPDPNDAPIYAELLGTFGECYTALAPRFAELGRIGGA